MRDLKAIALVVRTSFRVAPLLAVASVLFVPLARGSVVVVGLLLKLLTEAVVDGRTTVTVAVSIAIGCFAGLRWLLNSSETKVRMTLNERVAHALQCYVVDVTAGVPGIDHFERPEYLDQLILIRSAQWQIASVTETLVNAAATLFVLGSAVALLGAIDPLLLLLPLAGIPAMALIVLQNRRIRAVEQGIAPSWRLCEHLFRSSLTLPVGKEVRIFDTRAPLLQRQQEAYEVRNRSMWRIEARFAPMHALAWTLQAAAFVAAVHFVVRLVLRGEATLGDVALIIVVGLQIAEQMGTVVVTMAMLGTMLRTTGRLVWVMEYGREAARLGGHEVPPERISDAIALRDVSFQYPGTGAWVLRDVSLRIPAGSVVAIVGDNGAGKTSLVKLLCGMYQPTEGAILVDGADAASFDPALWRAGITAAFQDHAMFEVAMAEAVGIGDLPRAGDREAVRAALGRAAATDVASKLPAGLDTQLGSQWTGGVDLSGGEWQKVALGRAFMRRAPSLIILDEPTSALDAATEHEMFERYAEAPRPGSITVLVSHRFSTVRMADRIVVLDGGRIVEVGSHEELLASRGAYAEIYGLQARGYR